MLSLQSNFFVFWFNALNVLLLHAHITSFLSVLLIISYAKVNHSNILDLIHSVTSDHIRKGQNSFEYNNIYLKI